jgi:hypothetical protein
MRLKQLFVLGEEQREGSRWELGSHRRAHLWQGGAVGRGPSFSNSTNSVHATSTPQH